MCEVDTNRSLPWLSFDILIEIVKQSDQATLVSWTTTCRFLGFTAEKYLWSTLQVKYRDLELYGAHVFADCGASRYRPHLVPSNWPAHDGVVHSLAQDSPTQGPASRSRHYIKDLSCKLQNPSEPLEPFMLDNAIASFISRLPHLESCRFEGVVYDSTLEILAHIPTIQTLEIRTDSGHGLTYTMPAEQNADPVVPGMHRMQFANQTVFSRSTVNNHVGNNVPVWTYPTGWPLVDLDFAPLAQFSMLRKLHIGQLRRTESICLSDMLPGLQLESLELTAANPAFESVQLRNNSPFLMLFLHISTPTNGPRRYLPLTLKSLVLNDAHHRANPLSASSLLGVIRPCRKLAHLHVSHLWVSVESAQARFMDEFNAIPSLKTIVIEVLQPEYSPSNIHHPLLTASFRPGPPPFAPEFRDGITSAHALGVSYHARPRRGSRSES